MTHSAQPGPSTPSPRHGPGFAELTIFGVVFAAVIVVVALATGMDHDQEQLLEVVALLAIFVPIGLVRKHRTGHFYLPRKERAARAHQMGSARWGIAWFAVDVVIAIVAGVVSGKLIVIPVLLVGFAFIQLIDSAQWRWWGNYLDRHPR